MIGIVHPDVSPNPLMQDLQLIGLMFALTAVALLKARHR